MWALVPVKSLQTAKQRLASVLDQPARQQLVAAMLHDLLGSLKNTPSLDGVLVVSDDSQVHRIADHCHCEYLREIPAAGRDLNAAVAQGVSWLIQRGILAFSVIHGDLPLLTAQQMASVIGRHRLRGARVVTIVPDAARQGSNIVILSDLPDFVFAYGSGSLLRHVQEAARLGAPIAVHSIPSLSLDIDTLSELVHLLRCGTLSPHSKTFQFFNSREALRDRLLRLDAGAIHSVSGIGGSPHIAAGLIHER